LFSETRVKEIETPSFHLERLGYCFSASIMSLFQASVVQMVNGPVVIDYAIASQPPLCLAASH
jgi:hypothetical protein